MADWHPGLLAEFHHEGPVSRCWVALQHLLLVCSAAYSTKRCCSLLCPTTGRLSACHVCVWRSASWSSAATSVLTALPFTPGRYSYKALAITAAGMPPPVAFEDLPPRMDPSAAAAAGASGSSASAGPAAGAAGTANASGHGDGSEQSSGDGGVAGGMADQPGGGDDGGSDSDWSTSSDEMTSSEDDDSSSSDDEPGDGAGPPLR